MPSLLDMEESLEEGCSKSGEMSGDSLVINEDVEDQDSPEGGSSETKGPTEWEEGSPGEEEALRSEPLPAPALTTPVSVPTSLPARMITTLNVPSVTVSSHHQFHHPPPNIPSLPPGTIAKPVLDPSSSAAGKSPEAPSEDGHDPTVRKLILTAIEVMKNRKARPDGKRISNWINRRYGRPVVSINEELEKMVIGGELTRVDYKGSASYRITTAEAKSARRRRRLQKNNSNNAGGAPGSSNSNNPREGGGGGLIVEPILRQPSLKPPPQTVMASSPQIIQPMSTNTNPQLQMSSIPPQPQFSASHQIIPQIQLTQKIPSGPQHHLTAPSHLFHPAGSPIHYHQAKLFAPQEITLRTLVCDYMAELSSSGMPIGDEIDIKFIGRSVDVSRRPINRGAVLANLENILEKEIQAGHFIKTAEDLYVMQPSIVGGYHHHHHHHPSSCGPPMPYILSPTMTNTIINPAPMPPPPSAGPPPFLSTSSAPPPPQILNVGGSTLTGPNLSEYMYSHPPSVSNVAAIPLTVTSSAPQDSRSIPMASSSSSSGPLVNLSHPPPPPTSTSLASATPPLPNFTKMTFISSGAPRTSALTCSSTTAHSSSLSASSTTGPSQEQQQQHRGQESSRGEATPQSESKSDEERKNDLIQEKVFKMNKSLDKHSPSRKNGLRVNSTPESRPASAEPLYILLREKRLNAGGRPKSGNLLLEHAIPHHQSNGSSVTPSAPPRRGVGRPKKTPKGALKPTPESNSSKRRKKEVLEEDEEDGEDGDEDLEDEDEDDASSATPQDEWKNRASKSLEASGVGGNTRSSRKKKSRKIFDPADHETPSRKRKIVSSTSSPTPSVDEDFVAAAKEDTCLFCGGSTLKNKKGKPETLLKCKDCGNIVHPSCLDYTEDLCRKILEAPFWQCINCKTCAICELHKEDQPLVFCDGCDLAFHRECHSPKIPPSSKMMGFSWECAQCRKTSSSKSSSSSSGRISEGMTNGHDLPMEPLAAEMKQRESLDNGALRHQQQQVLSRLILPPNLPPHLHPHTGNIPENWEDYLPDPDIPDVSYWDPKQVEEHFLRLGFSPDQAVVFHEQEIDGKSLLLLQRSDVTSSLGLKLGPALKMFNHIKKLQTRRHFPG